MAVLASALERLAISPGLRYKGAFGASDVDMRVARSGAAYGSMVGGGSKLRILTLKGRTFVRAGKSFWSSASTENNRKARARQVKLYAKRWVAIDAARVGDPGGTLRPSELASRFRGQLRTAGVTDVQRGKAAGKPVSIIAVGSTKFHVTAGKSHRLVWVEQPRGPGGDRGSRDGARGAGAQMLRVESLPDSPVRPGEDPGDSDGGVDDDGLGFDEMDPLEVDDFYDDVDDEVKRRLGKALDARVNFNASLTGGINCPFGSGACRVTARVSNSVATGRDVVGVSGRVLAVMTAFVTGPANSATCMDVKSMRVNASRTMTCVAGLILPRCNRRGGVCTWPVTATIMVVAQAKLKIKILRKDLRRDRDRDKDQAECQSGTKRCERPVKGSKAGADALKKDVEALRRKRNPRRCNEGTVAVVRVAEKHGDGTTKKLVAAEASEKPSEWTDNDMQGMEFVEGRGHAEATIVNWLKHHGNWYIVEGAVQRNICKPGEAPNCDVSCMEHLQDIEDLTLGPAEHRAGTRYKSRIRSFWTE